MRESDPTIMDVTYISLSDTPTVKVRALAFENGERSFASVVRPETFIEGTDMNIGDGIAANCEHRLSWKMPADWATDLAKVKFEVLAMKPGDLLLPKMHFVTIPATDEYPALKVSLNELTPQQVFDALMWLYADNDPEMTLVDGTLMTNLRFEGGNVINDKSWLASNRHESDYVRYGITSDANWGEEIFKCWSFGSIYYSLNAPAYVLYKMGYSFLPRNASITKYVESILRWDYKWSENVRYGDLKYDGVLQYAVKIIEE